MENNRITVFDNVMGDTTVECNEFLRNLKAPVISITPLWNNIMGGVVYVVIHL